MDALIQTDGQALAKTASDECSRELWLRLTDSRVSWSDAVRELSTDPVAVKEISSAVTRLEAHTRPATSAEIVAALAPMIVVFGVSDRSEGEWKTFWELYIEALKELPLEAIKAGVADFVKSPTAEWFPKPGPLRAFCDQRAIPLRMAANRARQVVKATA